MKDDAGLRRACKKGQAQMTNRVEHALAHKAVGMVLPDSHVSNYQGVVTVTPLEKHLAPDTLAQHLLPQEPSARPMERPAADRASGDCRRPARGRL